MNEKIILALDLSTKEEVEKTILKFREKIKWVKVGMELFYSQGPDIVHYLKDQDFSIFLDLKLHDIPNTVGQALKNLCKLPIDMINLHTLGGSKMMSEASAVVKDSLYSPYLIGVTQLTSTDEQAFIELGFRGSLVDNVAHLAQLAHQNHLDGVVCSAHEVPIIKNICGADFLCVTPGIRLLGSSSDDQKRIMTPDNALKLGSDFLVMGRTLINNPQLIDQIPGETL
ncbi:MAG TPA: orotidine-5'-phosphate decarboxylase [Bacteriovoracaceae bacterium]|nr:orotidine-5'-phosphate decarboxylase [Bacteriovoracaceae bacterium]